MDFQPTADQTALVEAIGQILEKHRDVPRVGVYANYSQALDAAIREAGFLDVAREEGMGGLEAALIVEAIARSPAVVEAAASALVTPKVLGQPAQGPVALVADVQRAARFLDVARSAFVLTDDGAVFLDVGEGDVEAVHSSMAYPFGRFRAAPDLAKARRLTADETARLMTWWRVALAVETAGAMQAAIDFTVDYVTNRRQFNKPLGSMQAIQHRLAERTVQVQATRWLAIEAAWRGEAAMAGIAATYAQNAIPAVRHDMHQFNGALGITLDHPLHYWTYRLAALQGELGGGSAQALAAAKAIWDNRPVAPAAKIPQPFPV